MPASETGVRRKKRQPVARSLVWFTSRSVARQLAKLDCSLVGIFADIATDKKIDPAIRFRAAERLAMLLYGARPNDRPAAPPLDVSAIIARAWDGDQSSLEGPHAHPETPPNEA
jgi:hypothetical protein